MNKSSQKYRYVFLLFSPDQSEELKKSLRYGHGSVPLKKCQLFQGLKPVC